jgi:2-polyprenyl-3-methyl-5-hydroxy-6-metoxy-1,4-benzoquinol methylase
MNDQQTRGALATRRRRARAGTCLREIDDESWFSSMDDVFKQAYLAGGNPLAQSGFGGDAARWEAGRRPIAEAIDRGGSFLDIGCASGQLLESLVAWSLHSIEPFGLDWRRDSPPWLAAACRTGPTGSSLATR